MCLHYAPRGRDIDLTVHGDDFVTVGDHQYILWLEDILESNLEISTVIVDVNVLDRVTIVVENGCTYAADARHA